MSKKQTVSKATTDALRGIDLALLAIDPATVKISRTYRDEFTGEPYVEITRNHDGRETLVARATNDTVTAISGKTEADVALTNAVIALYSDSHQVALRDGDLILVDVATGADVRDAWNTRAARRSNWDFWGRPLLTATIAREAGLTVYNHAKIDAIPAATPVAA